MSRGGGGVNCYSTSTTCSKIRDEGSTTSILKEIILTRVAIGIDNMFLRSDRISIWLNFIKQQYYHNSRNCSKASVNGISAQQKAFIFNVVTKKGNEQRTSSIQEPKLAHSYVHTGPAADKNIRERGKVTSLCLAAKKRRGEKITMVTAYDYPSAMHVDRANVDVLLVGDSCAMVELGYDTTQPLTMDEICMSSRGDCTVSGVVKAVRRGAPHGPLLVGDLPLGSYEVTDEEALRNSYRFIKECQFDAVKIEGGSQIRARTVKTIVEGGVAVMGHVGLTPQAISVIGGFRAQGRTAVKARILLDEALRLQEAGAFAIVIECVPAQVAQAITESLEIPTIGIGAGPHTSGQVLVFHDMLGMMSHPHHEHFVPKFCKKYARVGDAISKGLADFCKDVQQGVFPGKEFSPYMMTETEGKVFAKLLENDADKRELIHKMAAERLKNADEYETLDLYGKTEK